MIAWGARAVLVRARALRRPARPRKRGTAAGDADALQDVERARPGAATARYTVEGPAPEAARAIWHDLENSGKFDRKTGPLTGGAGI